MSELQASKWEQRRQARAGQLLPSQLVIGVLLIAIMWPLAWIGPAPYSEYTFFPLWLGYILTIDGITLRRTGTSLLSRDARRFMFLFVCSIPLWWLFEFANQSIDNWRYMQDTHHRTVAYVFLASLAFSTVMPAVFATAEFYRSFESLAIVRRWLRISPPRSALIAIAGIGLLMFIASLVFPGQAFPLTWIGVFLFLDPINAVTGGKSLTAQVAEGRWDTVLILFLSGITCGFFWEMWNFWSMPKWVYHVPYVGYPKLFEMPLLGYGGYLPFALEIYAFYQLVHTLVRHQRDTFLQFDTQGDFPESGH